jgi:outer membrane protein TolC
VARAETLTLTRARAVQLALERNEAHRQVALEADRVEGLYVEARAGALPSLTLEGEYLRNLELPTSVITLEDTSGQTTKLRTTFGTKNDYRMTLRLRQPLYVGGKVGAALKIAGYGRRLTEAHIETSRNNTATAADRAYLDAVAAQLAMEVYVAAEELADSNLNVVRALYAQGQVSEYDLLRAQVRAANVRPDRIAARNAARLAADRLRALLALTADVALTLDTVLPQQVPARPDRDSLLAEALANRPELHQAAGQVDINRKLISIARAGSRPSLSLSSALQWSGISDDFGPSKDEWYRSWNASLNLSWPIFTGFAVSGQVRQAKVDLYQSELAQSGLERQVRLDVEQAAGNLEEASERLLALGETVDQALRGVAIARVRYENGMGTQLELLDAEVALTQARVNRIAALHDLAIAQSELRRAVGRPWAPEWPQERL